ncbi:MAG: 3'(2'),5'-bisphosphate nucleotidase [Planctomycetota bacterium]|nr:3'(2'),5'-bisphosphate nucleotidase [Planctomycetota bacterium]MDA1210929.1 3'(2'),5'-bisphosphate nucleotidase [Planctomycetota bacterium]
MTADYLQELKTAIPAVSAAMLACRSVQSKIETEKLDKKDKSPVTVADFSSQAIVCRTLSKYLPDDQIIAEEDAAELRQPANAAFMQQVHAEVTSIMGSASTDDVLSWIDRGKIRPASQRFWTLDPIDGTKGFLRKEQYAVSLALIVDGVIQVAVLGCPNLPTVDDPDSVGGLFYAVRGQGAFALKGEISTPIHVSQTSHGEQARMCESVESGHSDHDQATMIAQQLGITKESRRLDSQAKYAVVARGEADMYLRLPTRADYVEKIWDHAGGVLVVEEAGGKVTDIAGKPLDFSLGHELRANRGVIVTNGLLHDAVLTACRTVLG